MHKRTQGFTLLELMTAIAVLAVLMGLGVPAFTNIMRNSQIASQSGNLVTALTLARSEALKRGVRVSVCGVDAEDPEACMEGADWSNGWIVFADDFGDMGVVDENDEVLQAWPAPLSGVAIGTEMQSITFTRTARAEFVGSFDVTKPGCTGDQQRQIDVSLSGRVSLTRVECAEED
jgi:type IV fimbrial biogenesis protein FimT